MSSIFLPEALLKASTGYRPLKAKTVKGITKSFAQEGLTLDFPATLSNRQPKQSGDKNMLT